VSEASPIQVAIIDDDPSYGRAVARLLRASGMKTRVFASAEEYLSSGGEGQVDCLLLDVQLGGMSGLDLQLRLASAGSGAAVVFISGQADAEIAAKAAEAGCRFVPKSDPGEAVLGAIRQAVAGEVLPLEADAVGPDGQHIAR
jgi:FixJ family two-component response regulator